MSRLHIHDRRERALVTAADGLFATAAAIARPFRRRRPPAPPRRILLLRLERIGDLLMALPAIAEVAAFAPDAQIDLAVGSWNADLARVLTAVTHVETVDAAWLARDGGGLGLSELLRAARRWRRARYDLAINFEPDARSNMLAAASGAAWTAGYWSGGGGPLLDVALEYDTRAHTTDNAQRLVAAVFGGAVSRPRGRILVVPPEAHERAARLLPAASPLDSARLDSARDEALRSARDRPLVGVHVSGGRAIKQWQPDRFAAVARRLAAEAGATIVLTGSPADRPLVDQVKRALPPASVIDAAADLDLLTVAAILERLDLLITGDTGPMHLAAAVGTPVVAIFGPSEPARYAPRGPDDRIVRIDLPCSPCNRIRRPPARCVGHTPDCLASVSIDSVFAAAMSVLDAVARRRGEPAHTSSA
jgi:ADP-heptose:LPS heptosyltransferase